MRQYREKSRADLTLESNRRRLKFEMREVLWPAINAAQSAMEKEFFEKLNNGEILSLDNDTAETRRFLLEGVFKELNGGANAQASIEP